MTVDLVALHHHWYYDHQGNPVRHAPGERYSLDDHALTVWTATQLAEVLIAAQLAALAPSNRAKGKPAK